MKKKSISLLLALLLITGLFLVLSNVPTQAAVAETITADTVEGVSVTYKVLTENTAESTGTVQVGTGLSGDSAIDAAYAGTVTIPATVEYSGITYTVTEIAYKAMYNCHLTGINLPNTISSIGAYAFNATGLTQIELPLSLSRINGYAFSNCGGLTSVSVPESVTFLGGSAFTACANLADVTLPDSLTELPDYLFKDCTSLNNITLGSNVQSIGYQTFYGCTALTEITLPASLTEIYSDAFRNCSSLANVYFDGDCPTLSGANHFVGVASPAYANVYESAANFPFEGQDLYGLTVRYMDDNAQQPLITAGPQDKTVRTGNAASLTVNANVLDGGTLSYQWYSHTVKQNTGGTLIPGATNFTYVLPTSVAGSYYYYVEVTNTNTAVSGNQTATAVSYPATVTVYDATDAETPVISTQPADVTANQGTTVTLSVSVAPLSDGGTLSYAWYENTADSYSGGVFVGEESSVIAPYLGVRYYYVIVTNTNNSVSGAKTASVTSDIARVTIHPLINAQEPEITVQPQDQSVSVGDPVTLSVDAVSLDGGELTYQWYVNNFPSTLGATELSGAVQTSYSPSTAVSGANYYFVVITNTNNDLSGVKSAQIVSDIAAVDVSSTSYTITVQNDGHGTAGANPNPAVEGQTVQLGYLADSGYQFKEWQVISGTIDILPDNTFMMPASAVTVKAIFEDIPDYTVTVSDDGNGEGSADPAAADAGVTVTITAVNYSSYVFKEWQVISGGVILANSASATTTFTMPAGNVEVRATFEPLAPGLYTLNLQSSAGGTAICDGGSGLTASQNTLVNLWTSPNSGYVFQEWQLISGTFDVSNITEVSDNWYQFMMPASNLVLKAVFEATAPVTYTVTFDANGGSGVMSDQTFTEGVAQALTANAFTRTDYNFDGWATSAAGSVDYTDGQSVTMTADITLYAVWSEVPSTYTVTFNANGGSGVMSDQTFTEGVAQALTANAFTRTDYTFDGWALLAAGSVVYTNGQSVTLTENTTLYAVWSAAAPDTYTVTFDANGGSGVMSDQTFTEEVAQALTPNAFTRTDYNFLGWAQTPSGGVVYTDGESITVEYDRTLYARWASVTAPQFTVTFDANGGSGTMSPQIFTQGVSQPLTANAFTRMNYTFLGWALSPTGGVSFNDRDSLNVGGDTILYAVWSAAAPATYTVTFDANGGSGAMSPQVFTEGVGQALTANAFTRTDYNFDGWATSASGSVDYTDGQSVTMTADTTLYAVWSAVTPATYTVTVQDEGNGSGSASPNPAAEGETVTLSNTPDAGYQFDEWQVISGGVTVTGNTFTMPANNVTVKAVFEAAAPPALVGSISEMDKSNIGLGDTIYMGSAGGVPISWRVVSGSGSTGSMTLLATRKVDDVTEFDRDPDGEAGPETPSNNYRDSDLRDYLNNNFAGCLNGAERSSVIKVRAFDAETGVSLSNTVADEDGDYSYIPLETQIVNWNLNASGVNQYWASYWVRDPDLNPHEGYMMPAEGGGKMRVFLTSEYAPRPAVVISTSNVASVSQVVYDNTGKPWELLADETNYSPAATGKAYMIGISYPADLSITGVPETAQTTSGSYLQLNGLSPSINDGSASIVYLIYKKSDGSILQYQTIEANGLSSIEIDAAGIPAGSGYAVRMWLQKNTVNYSPALSPFYTFDLTISADAPVQYTVTFDANGGSGTMSSQTFTEGVSQALAANAFVRSGHVFEGWAATPVGAVAYENNESVTMAADNTLYAVWSVLSPAQHTVTFNANGGSGTMSPQTFTEGIPQALAANAYTRSGFTFSGWANSAGGSVSYNNSQSITISADTTLYAVWNPLSTGGSSGGGGGGGSSTPASYSATAGAQPENGSVSLDKASAPAGTKVTVTATPDKGYTTGKITVTDKDGRAVAVTENQDGTYSFIMPAGGVTVTASFVAEQPGTPAVSYADVKDSDWFYECVKYVCEKGLMVGTAESQFSPDLTTSRSMIVSILYRLEGSPSVSAGSFSDVADGQWYTGGVAWASANGIVAGYGNGLFGPDDNITREQLAVILYNYAKYKGYNITPAKGLDGFIDSGRVSSWAKTAMEWAVGCNLLFGKGNNTLAPADSATRSEMAAIIQRFIEDAAK